MNIVGELKKKKKKLDMLDSYLNSMSELESNVDMKLSDLYHYIEFNTLKTNECYRIVKEIKKQREIRRNLKNDYALLSTYRHNHQRLNNENNRKMLMAEMYKAKNKELKLETNEKELLEKYMEMQK